MTRPVSAITPDGRPCIVHADRVDVPTGKKHVHESYNLRELAIRRWTEWHAGEVRRAL